MHFSHHTLDMTTLSSTCNTPWICACTDILPQTRPTCFAKSGSARSRLMPCSMSMQVAAGDMAPPMGHPRTRRTMQSPTRSRLSPAAKRSAPSTSLNATASKPFGVFFRVAA
eukprot:4768073-Lingulodinium_polyedra.AAC.1